MLAQEFTEVLRDENRRMRDMLLGLIDAFEASDSEAIRDGIEEIAAHAGPRFQYEEEALYPALADLYGDNYVNRLLEAHESALEAAQKLAELADLQEMDAEASEYGVELARQLLPHVAERDGLAVMVEVLEPEAVERIHKAHEKATRSGATLAALAARRKGRRRIAKVGAKGRGKGAAKAGKAKAAKRVAKPAPKAKKPRARRRA